MIGLPGDRHIRRHYRMACGQLRRRSTGLALGNRARARLVATAENMAHCAAQLVGDVVAGNPCAGAVAERGEEVRGIRLSTDDHDPVNRITGQFVVADGWEIGAVDNHQVGAEVADRTCKLARIDTRRPATKLAVQEFEDQPPHRRVCERDQHPWAGGTYRALVNIHDRPTAHSSIVLLTTAVGIRSGY